MNRPLWLRWLLANSLAVVGAVALGLGFVRHIHGAPLVVVAIIVVITAAASAYAGRLFWNLDTNPAEPGLEKKVQHVDSVVYTCQVLAALGAILGVYLTASSGGSSAEAAVSGVLDAMANGLLATFTGILCSLLLYWEHHFLKHYVDE